MLACITDCTFNTQIILTQYMYFYEKIKIKMCFISIIQSRIEITLNLPAIYISFKQFLILIFLPQFLSTNKAIVLTCHPRTSQENSIFGSMDFHSVNGHQTKMSFIGVVAALKQLSLYRIV